MVVRFSVGSFKKAGFVGHGGHIQFSTSADMDLALAAFAEASDAAEVNGADGRDVISTSTLTRASGGPVANMHLCDNLELLENYLREMANSLEQAGLSGRLSPARDTEMPQPGVPALTAMMQVLIEIDDMVAAPYDYTVPDPAWWVSPERTARLVPPLIDWCLDTPGNVYFRSGFGLQVAPQDAKQLVLDNVLNSHLTLVRISEDQRSLRRLVLHESGGAFVQTYDPTRSWRDHLEALQAPLLQAAPDLAHAFVRSLPSSTREREQAWSVTPATPLADTLGIPSRMWFLAHLQPDYVPDAYGQQVITSSHRQRLSALPEQRWEIRDLGNDRHLVTAKDPAAWFEVDPRPYGRGDIDNSHTRTPVIPNAATRATARQDFDNAILTSDKVDQNPPPTLTGPRRF